MNEMLKRYKQDDYSDLMVSLYELYPWGESLRFLLNDTMVVEVTRASSCWKILSGQLRGQGKHSYLEVHDGYMVSLASFDEPPAGFRVEGPTLNPANQQVNIVVYAEPDALRVALDSLWILGRARRSAAMNAPDPVAV
jgi:hypothetical protein